MPSIDKLRHNIRHAVSLSAFSPNLIHRIRYFFLCTVTFRDHSLQLNNSLLPSPKVRLVFQLNRCHIVGYFIICLERNVSPWR